MKYFILFLFIILGFSAQAQELTGKELLDKAITFHDPQSKWSTLSAKMLVEMETPNSSLRKTYLEIDFPKRYFKSTVIKDNYTIESELDKEACILKLNGSTSIFPRIKDSLRISCDRAKSMKNYYTYLYGLPMKLKDTGTQIDPKVKTKTFKGKKYLVLKATYNQEIGKDTWYFYFDPKTFAMEVYQFFHNESENDGEYILLSDLIDLNGIKTPKKRAWYYNKDDKYLGTDNLVKATKRM